MTYLERHVERLVMAYQPGVGRATANLERSSTLHGHFQVGKLSSFKPEEALVSTATVEGKEIPQIRIVRA